MRWNIAVGESLKSCFVIWYAEIQERINSAPAAFGNDFGAKIWLLLKKQIIF